MKPQVDTLLEADFSPGEVTGYLNREKMDRVSYGTVYQYVWADRETETNSFISIFVGVVGIMQNVVTKQMGEVYQESSRH